MKNLIVITALGEDRPGIIRNLSSAISETGSNIEDCRLSILGKEVALMMMVSGRWNELAKLESSLPNCAKRMGMDIQIRRTEAQEQGGQLLPYSVEVIALDAPGIVAQLTEFFASRDINIREMNTSNYTTSGTGTIMFSLQLTIDVPAGIHISTLRDEFMSFCDQLNLDSIMEPAK
ncbi:glycine cleavage system protein R [Halorhodospira halochloris]|uniref:Glycine cleavage system transcriptional repressor n=1 Tax=Halorhodospira halochloris TaxID=1052 RepID=A0A120MZM2_HALHR|nr:ACT domain-containing protein [Halorhodospira halochloris]MBK1652272.1 glycine cleavage system protein R [Halorhodospira halochloris]MCG5530668.1 glycine cleavage system protein R [Halorhodospira halochloris]BAU56933.1 glycine cleavage system transcriptional antiactivator GcvR [Halorhodospira halochloris]